MDSPEEAVDVARTLAKRQQSVIATSGPTDHITDGERLVDAIGADGVHAIDADGVHVSAPFKRARGSVGSLI